MTRSKRSRVTPIVSKQRVTGALRKVRKYFPNVTSVEDAEKPIHIEVTPRDVTTSKRKKHAECAMAVACKRSMSLEGVIIATSTAYLIKDNKATRYKVPESVSREIVSFDRGASFEPGKYDLKAPREGHKIGTYGGGTSHTGTGKHHPQHITTNVRAILGSDIER